MRGTVRKNRSVVSKPIRGQMEIASTTEAVDPCSIPCRVKPKTRKLSIHSFPASRSAIKETV